MLSDIVSAGQVVEMQPVNREEGTEGEKRYTGPKFLMCFPRIR